jgi:hypothetical protein
VTFASDVSRCAYVATVGDPANALVFNPSGVYTGSGPDPNTVYIETKNAGGGLTDGIPFHLAVICPGAIRSYAAVVRPSGLIMRGTGLTSTYKASTGNYVLVSKSPLTSCAVVATRGSVDTSVPFNPSTVELTPGPAPNTIGLQVRKLLFFGGALDNQSFHAAAVC